MHVHGAFAHEPGVIESTLSSHPAAGRRETIPQHVTRPLDLRASMATVVKLKSVGFPNLSPVSQNLRAARNRERGELRALIAQGRKASNASGVEGSPEGSPDGGDGSDQVREWSTPSGWAAGSPLPRPRQPDARVAASEPPPRRRFRSQSGNVPRKGALADKGRSPGGGSVDAPHRPQWPRNNREEGHHKATAKKQAASSSSSSEVARFVMLVFFLCRFDRKLGHVAAAIV